jgi:hypothetical protein
MPKLVQNAVGEKVYVWSKRTGGPSSDANGQCVISAHGAQSVINSRFPIRNVKLIFYNPHGSSLVDPGIKSIMTGGKLPTEVVASGTCRDYLLSKYQGRHQGGRGPGSETYEFIGGLGDQVEGQAEIWRDIYRDAFKRGDIDALRQASHLLSRYNSWMDIVTIRHRPLKIDPMLSEVITALQKAGYRYTTIHCVFCRGPQLPQLPWKAVPDFHAPDVT